MMEPYHMHGCVRQGAARQAKWVRQHHRVPDRLTLAEASSSRDTQNRMPRTCPVGCGVSSLGDLQSHLGNLWQCSITSTGQKGSLMFRRNLLCVSLFPLPLGTGHHYREPVPILFMSSLQVSADTDEIPMSFLFSRQYSPSPLNPSL